MSAITPRRMMSGIYLHQGWQGPYYAADEWERGIATGRQRAITVIMPVGRCTAQEGDP